MHSICRFVFLLLVVGLSSSANAEGTIVQGFMNITYMVRAGAALIITIAAFAGLWYCFTGVKDMVTPGAQVTPGQSLMKFCGGLVMISLMAWISALATDFGIEATTNPAITVGFGG